MESALIVPVPEAEPAVGPLGTQFDPSAPLGVPAHITVMYPFVEPDRIDEAVIERLRGLFASVSAFDFALTSVEWFEPAVLWLAPEPSLPFRSLTETVIAEWPGLRPYGGVHDDVIPHLTVGQTDDRADLLDAEREVRAAVPIACRAREVRLIVGSPESRWETLERFAFEHGARAEA